jgi:hypothetical protein
VLHDRGDHAVVAVRHHGDAGLLVQRRAVVREAEAVCELAQVRADALSPDAEALQGQRLHRLLQLQHVLGERHDHVTVGDITRKEIRTYIKHGSKEELVVVRALPELRVALRPEEVGELADAGGVAGLPDAEALERHAGDLPHVAPVLAHGGHVPPLGFQREREDLRQRAVEQRPPHLRGERVVLDDDAAVRRATMDAVTAARDASHPGPSGSTLSEVVFGLLMLLIAGPDVLFV